MNAANQCVLIRDARHPGQMLADQRPRHARLEGRKLPADLARCRRFGIETVEVTRPAELKQQNDAASSRFPSAGTLLGLQKRRQIQPRQAKPADFQHGTAAQLLTQEIRTADGIVARHNWLLMRWG